MGYGQWFHAAVDGRLDEVYAAEKTAARKAITAGIKQAASLTQNAYRRQVKKAGLGEGLEKAWQLKMYPGRGDSMDAAALVFSKSRRLHLAFSQNRTIRATKAKSLLVPTPLAERLGLTVMPRLSSSPIPRKWFDVSQAEYMFGRLWVMESNKGNGALLMAQIDGLPKALAWIVRQVRLKKVLDLEGPPKQFMARVPQYIIANFNRLERIKSSGTRVLLAAE